MTLPTPPQPPTDPTPEAVAAWERDMRYWEAQAKVEAIAASDRHGKAQQATADAMKASTQVKWAQSRQELVLFFAGEMKQRATDTPNTYFDACAAMADQFLKEHGKPDEPQVPV